MTRPTREELLSYFKKYGVERVNSITGEESAIHYFRTKAFYYREENKKLSENIDKLEKRNKELEKGDLNDVDYYDYCICYIAISLYQY
ncbi:hypothetical protein ODE11_11285 [Staphylococcus aureus]|nr:hypothetical protein [Staphylococcus aureus]